MSDAVAIVSIVVSGLGAPTIAANYALRNQRAKAAEDRRSELRESIDFAAEQAGAAYRRISDVHAAWQDGIEPASLPVSDRARFWRDSLEGPRHAHERLATRVMGHDPTELMTAYGNYLTALDHYRREVDPYFTGAPFDRAAVFRVSSAAHHAREAFIAAAYQRVGIRPRDMSPLWSTLPLTDDIP